MENETESEFEEGTCMGTITSDMILDLYEQCKQMDEGPLKEEKLNSIKYLTKNLGRLLVKR